MKTTTLLAALRPAHEDALRILTMGDPVRAAIIDATLLKVGLALVPELEDDDGQARALRVILDPAEPQPIDALAAPMWSLATVRMELVRFLPAAPIITAVHAVEDAIHTAIRYGAPTYNDGDARGCGTCYWATAFAITLAPVTRGVPGLARALKPLRTAIEEPIPAIGEDARGQDEFAWRMRHALDTSLAALR